MTDKDMRVFGGASVNWNTVKSSKIEKDYAGKDIFIIEFNSGAKVQYRKQKKGATLDISAQELGSYDFVVEVKAFKGLRFTGSADKKEWVEASDVKDSLFDMEDDNKIGDRVTIVGERKFNLFGKPKTSTSKNNTFNLDFNDTLNIADKNTDYERHIYGPAWHEE